MGKTADRPWRHREVRIGLTVRSKESGDSQACIQEIITLPAIDRARAENLRLLDLGLQQSEESRVARVRSFKTI